MPSITNIIPTQRLIVLGTWERPLRRTKISYKMTEIILDVGKLITE